MRTRRAVSVEWTFSRWLRIWSPRRWLGRGGSSANLMQILLVGFVLVLSASWRPAALNAAPPNDEKLAEKESTDVTTVGDDDVDPIEFKGQVLDLDAKPASKSVVRIDGFSTKLLAGSSGASITTDDEGRFRVRLRLKKERLPQLKLTAVNADNSQIGFYRFPWNKDERLAPIGIQLAASRVARVKVVDKSGAAIDKADVAIQLLHPIVADPVQTGVDGIAQFVTPATERINTVVAWKDGAGLDYRQYELSREQAADVIAKAPEFPASGIETLILDGVSHVSVKVSDEDGVPLKDVGVYPWLLKKESENNLLNLGNFRTIRQRTNDEGITTFAWMPAWQTGLIEFWPSIKGYDLQRGSYTPGKDNGLLHIILKKLVPIKGQVRDANGFPAAGVIVSAVGAGYSFDHGHGTAVTDKDGTYELFVPPDQIYLVTATTRGHASTPQTGFAVYKGKPVDGKDFALRPATRIHGKLVNEETLEPIGKASIFVYQYGQDLHSMTGVVLANPTNSRNYVQPITVHSAQTDDKGQFELFVGDGKFDIRPPQQEKADKFEIAGDSEREFVVTTKMNKQVELVGTVKDAATDQPLAGAIISGVSRNRGGRDWKATTNQAGEFRVMQFPASTFVYAVSSDKKLGTIAEIEAKQASVALTLQPVGSARGRLLTTETKAPWGQQGVLFGVRVPDEENRTWSNRFGGRVMTAADGTFELTGLVPGWKYELQMDYRSDGTIPGLGNAVAKPGKTTNLGDVSPPPPRKPYVPPTLEEQITDAFDVKGTPVEREAKAKDLIQLVNQHLLIVFGVPEDPRIHRLMKIRFEDEDFGKFRDEFRFMAIPTDEKRKPDADQLASRLNESLDGDRSAFLLVLLDSQGNKVGTNAADELIVDGELSRDNFFEWLRQFIPEPKDARKLLNDALAEARQQNKRVIVQETATWCGPCHRLSRFLNANRIWEKDYIWVKMDYRYTGVDEVMSELRQKAEGGIPWIAILDADGTKLATSNDPKSKKNIGYPSEASGQSHFEQMLKSTRQRLTDDEITGLIQVLAAGNQ